MLGAAKAAAGAATGTTAAKAVAVTGLSTVVALTVIVSSLLPGMGTKAADAATCGTNGSGPGGASAPQVSQEPSETAVADIPPDYLKLYRSGAEEYGIDSMILAAVGKIETDHGEDILNEGSGAAGPMQFMPSTWETAGLDANGDGVADINDPEDAIPSAAKYLRDSGAPEDYYTALFAYNNSDEYVNTVLAQADEYRAASGDDSTLALLLRPAYALVQGLTGHAANGADALGQAAASPFEVRPADATMNSWDLVDENLNLHYESHTKFEWAVQHGASAWNDLGVVNIAPSPDSSETDVVIGDTYEESGNYGWATPEGNIYFVAYKAEESTENAVNTLAAHELGHVIGFDHTEEPSVMNTPTITDSNSNIDTPSEYDRAEYAERWGGSEAPAPEEQPQSSDAPEEQPPSPEAPEVEGSGEDGETEGGTFEGDTEGPNPGTGSPELFEQMFGENYEGTSTSSGGSNEGFEEGGSNGQVVINQSSSHQTSSNNDGEDGGSGGGSGGGSNEGESSGEPEINNAAWPFNIFGGGDQPEAESGGGKNERSGNEDDGPAKKQYGDQEGGGGGGEEAGAKAVFPLPSDYQDDYQNDWGAARSQGGHEGTDIFAPDGTSIASITDGNVVKSGWDDLGGNTVLIEATADVGPVKTGDVMYYAHMQSASPLQPGDTVAAGDSVGQVGSTGEGPSGALLPDGRGQHLHLGWYDESENRAEAASGAMNPFPLLEWLVDNGGEATGGPTAPGPCPDDPGGSPSGTPGSPEGSPEGTPSGGGDGDAAVEEAKKYMGVPYVLGGPEACIPGEQMDCTCLTTTVFKAVGGYDLPDWPQDLFNYGEPVSDSDLQAGDLVIYADPGDGTGGHVGIAINSTEMIHACLPCGETVIGPIFDVPNYAGARRLV